MLNKKTLFLLLLFLISTFSLSYAKDNKKKKKDYLEITRVTPVGKDIKKRDQIVIQFNRPVVPVGEMSRDLKEIPIEITPKVNCKLM